MSPGFNMQSDEQTGGGKDSRGFLVSRRAAFGLILLALAALVLTALLTHHLATTPSPCTPGDDDDINSLDPLPSTTTLDVRLPRAIKPSRYEVQLVPELWAHNDSTSFQGNIKILLNVTDTTDNITLHIHHLDINEAETRVRRMSKGHEGHKVEVTGHQRDEARQFLIVKLATSLEPETQYELELVFTGELNDELQGFYRSSYVEDGQTRWIATTQFQPTDARRAFPCFDEPALKARFRISIAHPSELHAVSNMPPLPKQTQESVDKKLKPLPAGWEWTHFAESVPMSTYLVAFVVSPLSVKHSTEKGSNVSVWARRDALAQADYALSVGPAILKYFESYFGLKFPLPKIDMMALPDFAAGAMENWGLITYRETAMLFEDGVSTASNKQRVATVVSHELAHQWFGNLVTPAWWSDLWLNEGFASYVEYLGVNAVEPGWQVTEQFVVDEIQNVFTLDALKTSHPISVVVGHPDEINEIFDRISYSKGASIIRMMDHFLTTPVFKTGLNNYLKSKAFSSATQADLWEALTTQAHKDGALDRDLTVATIMDSWTLQTGFPVITVVRDYKEGTADIAQERFLLTPDNATTGEKPLWWVPVTYTTSEVPDFNTTKPRLWLRKPTGKISGLPQGDGHWLLLNVQQTGFYRVSYDTTNWVLLTAALDSAGSGGLSSITRAQLLDDSLALARAGRLNYNTALEVTRYLAHETEYLPWKSALTALSYVDAMLVKTAAYANFKSYMLQQLSAVYNATGLEERPNESQLTVYTRVLVLSWVCSLGHKECVKHSVDAYAKWRQEKSPDTSNPVPANLKNVVYCTAIRNGGQEEWDFAWQRYRNTNVGSEKDLLLSALGCSRETWILSRYLLWAVTDGSGIRKQDAARVFASVSSNVIGQPLAFAFLRDQWNRIKEHLGVVFGTLSDIFTYSTDDLTTFNEYKQLREFATRSRSELGQAKRAVQQALERTQANQLWMDKNADTIEKWLAKTVAS